MTGLQAQGACRSRGIEGKQRIHLGHDPNRGHVLGIEFDRVEEFATGVRESRPRAPSLRRPRDRRPRSRRFAADPARAASSAWSRSAPAHADRLGEQGRIKPQNEQRLGAG